MLLDISAMAGNMEFNYLALDTVSSQNKMIGFCGVHFHLFAHLELENFVLITLQLALDARCDDNESILPVLQAV